MNSESSNDEIHRRMFLGGLLVAGTTFLAGCAGASPGGEVGQGSYGTTSPTPTPTPADTSVTTPEDGDGWAPGAPTTESATLPLDGADVSVGWAVALDGDTALVDARSDDGDSVYVFRREGETWTREGELAVDGDRDSLFGFAVSVSGDTAIVGAPHDPEPNGDFAGAAYVFTRDAGEWALQAKLVPDDGEPNGQFGWSVSVAGDTVLVGAAGSAIENGSAYVFARSGETWSQQAKLVPDDEPETGHFGYAVALDGDAALVGDSANGKQHGDFAGSAYVFVRSGGTWEQQARLLASDGDSEDYFGIAVSIDGDTVLVGAAEDEDPNGERAGSAYVFARSGESWRQETKLTSGDGGPGDAFGDVVSLSGDTAVVGAPQDPEPNGDFAGSAYAFVREAGRWTRGPKLVTSDGASNDGFGGTVAVTGDTVLVGTASKEDVYVFEL